MTTSVNECTHHRGDSTHFFLLLLLLFLFYCPILVCFLIIYVLNPHKRVSTSKIMQQNNFYWVFLFLYLMAYYLLFPLKFDTT